MKFSKINSPIYLFEVLALLLLTYSILVALKLPIYPDEVAYKIFIERYFYNDGYKQSLTPYCTTGFLVKPPLLLLPASIFGSFLTFLGGGWWSYRAMPLVSIIAIVLLIIRYNYIKCGRLPWASLLIVVITPCIYGLVILRPEIFILLGGLIIFLTSFWLVDNKLSFFRAYLLSTLILFIYSFLILIHPKALYLLPITLLFFLYTNIAIEKSIWKFIYLLFFMALIFNISLSAIELHKLQFLACNEVPKIQLGMNSQSINLLSIFTDPASFKQDINNFYNYRLFERSISQFTFKSDFDINYLPNIDKFNILIILLNILNLSILSILFMGISIVSVIGWLFLPIKKYLLFLALTLSYFVPYFLNINKNWYENSFFLGALMIIFSLYYPYFNNHFKSKISKYFILILKFLIFTAATGTAILIEMNFNTKFEDGFIGPGTNIPLNRDSVNESIRHLIARNSIKEQRGYVVDDLTYDSLKDVKVILPATYLSLVGDWPILVKKSLESNLINYGVTRCITLKIVNPKLNWVAIDQVQDSDSGEAICLFQVSY